MASSSIDEGTTVALLVASDESSLGFVVEPVVDDVNRLERRRHRKKQRINRKRRERASRWQSRR